MPRPKKRPGINPLWLEAGAIIRRNRARLGLSVQRAADRIGVTYSAVWAWENGMKKPGDADRLDDILGALEIGWQDRDEMGRRYKGMDVRILHAGCRVEKSRIDCESYADCLDRAARVNSRRLGCSSCGNYQAAPPVVYSELIINENHAAGAMAGGKRKGNAG